jgi:deazaflavin-dependent oxidoreductase (nitroreductase family)
LGRFPNFARTGLAGKVEDAMPGPGIRKWLYRLPLLLRRLGIHGYERVLGISWIAVTTRGRRSGRPHAVMLDVIGRDEPTDTWYVSPANGRRSEWVRNALAEPAVTVEAGRRRVAARARDATGPEGAEVFLRFLREHRRYAQLVASLEAFPDLTGAPDEEVRSYGREMVVIALTPTR